jgi:hypothetical protein
MSNNPACFLKIKNPANINMKRKAVMLKVTLAVAASTAIAVVVQPFSSWESLIRRSPDIIIARCSKTPARSFVEKDGTVVEYRDGLIPSDIQVIAALKGATNLGPALLDSRFLPRQGEQYLIFSIFHDGSYTAVETYRVIPLGLSFPTNMLAGKSFNEQIRALLRYRLNLLNREMQQAQEEKNRLEEGLRQ